MFKRRNYTWNDGKSLSLCDRTLIMGILNGTPDSFSDGGHLTHQRQQQRMKNK